MFNNNHDDANALTFSRLCNVAISGALKGLVNTGNAMGISRQAIAVALIITMMRAQAYAIIAAGLPVEEFDGALERATAKVREHFKQRDRMAS